MANLPILLDRQREWKQRDLQAKQMRQAGLTVPKDFCPPPFFFSFQFDRTSILAKPHQHSGSPGRGWMFGRWAVSDAADMSKDVDFVQLSADAVSARLAALNKDL